MPNFYLESTLRKLIHNEKSCSLLESLVPVKLLGKHLIHLSAVRGKAALLSAVYSAVHCMTLHCFVHCKTVLQYIALFCTVLHCTVQYYTVLHCIAHSQLLNIIILKFNCPVLLDLLGNIFSYCPAAKLCPWDFPQAIYILYPSFCHNTDTVLQSIALYYTVIHCIALLSTVLTCIAVYCTVLHRIARYCTILHCIVLYYRVSHCFICVQIVQCTMMGVIRVMHIISIE